MEITNKKDENWKWKRLTTTIVYLWCPFFGGFKYTAIFTILFNEVLRSSNS